MTRFPLLIALVLVVAGCGAASPSAPGSISVPSPTPAVTTTAAPTPSPTPALATASAPAPSPTPAPSPQAEILGKGTIFAGYLGSYEIDGTGSDGPWLPFDSLSRVVVGAGETLTIRFVDGSDIGQAVAVIAAASDTTGNATQAVPTAPGGNAASVLVGPLPAGQWVLAVRLFRADGRGDGTTYWAITVS